MRPQCCLFWLRFSKSLGPEPHQLTNILVILEIFMIYLQSIQSSDTRQTKLKQKKICFYTMPSASQTKGGEKHHRCPMCNYSFNSAAPLKIHILVHTGPSAAISVNTNEHRVVPSRYTCGHIQERSLSLACSVSSPARKLVTSNNTC